MKHIQNFATFTDRLKQTVSLKEEQERSAKQEEYANFFKGLLQKYNVSSPAELSEDDKKSFFNEIDKGWDEKSGEVNEASSFNKIASKLTKVQAEMKKIAAEFKKAKSAGEDTSKIVSKLKDLTAEKKKLEAEMDAAISDMDKDTQLVVDESVNEAEVKSDEEFMEYAMKMLKKAHGDDFDEETAKKTAKGILSKADGDYGKASGMLQSSVG